MLDQLQLSVGSTGALLLRVQDQAGNVDPREQLFRVTARRCTIGTDETCNLRVRGPGTRPVHCLIVRGEEQTVIRRWSPDTLLNGQEFSDAVVSIGDRFQVGNTEIEVLAVNTAEVSAADGSMIEICEDPGASLPEISLRHGKSDRWLRQGYELNRARARRLLAQLRAIRQHVTESENRSAELSNDAELSTRMLQLQARTQELDAQAAALADARGRLETERRELEAGRDALNRDRAAWCEQQRRGLAELDPQRPRSGLGAFDATLRSAGLDQDSTDAPADNDVSTSAPRDSEEVRFEAASSEAPVTARALLSRLGVALPTDDPETIPPAEPAPSHHGANESTRTTASKPDQGLPSARAAVDAVGEESEDSIENMLARLLERVGNKPRQNEVSYQPATPTESRPRVASPSEGSAAQPAEKPALLTELPARSGRAPENAVEISAMRELAHQNARSLIDVHLRKTYQRTSTGQAVVAAVSLAVGTVLLLKSHDSHLGFYLGIICLAVAIVWGAQYAKSLRYLVEERSQKTSEGPVSAGEPQLAGEPISNDENVALAVPATEAPNPGEDRPPVEA